MERQGVEKSGSPGDRKNKNWRRCSEQRSNEGHLRRMYAARIASERNVCIIFLFRLVSVKPDNRDDNVMLSGSEISREKYICVSSFIDEIIS